MQTVASHADRKLPPRPTVLEPPPELRDDVKRDLAAYSPEARQRELDDRTLDYYCRDLDGVDIAYRSHPDGVEVVALGFHEVMAFRRGMPIEEQRKYTFRQL